MNSEETTLIIEPASTLCFILFFSDNAAGATEMGLGERKKHMLFLLPDRIQTWSPPPTGFLTRRSPTPKAGISCKLFPHRCPQRRDCMMLQTSVQLSGARIYQHLCPLPSILQASPSRVGGACLRGQRNSVLLGQGRELPVLYEEVKKQTSTNVKLFKLCCDAPRISAFEAIHISHLGMLYDNSSKDFEIMKSSDTLPVLSILDNGHSTCEAQRHILSSVLLGRRQGPLAFSSHPTPGSDSTWDPWGGAEFE